MAVSIETTGDCAAEAMALAELLAIRLCHDISGPLGTLMGSLELLDVDPGSAAEALPLASDVSVALAQRLRLMRAAWGNAAGALDAAGFEALAALPNAGDRLRVSLEVVDRTTRFSPAAARLALNVLMLARESLPHGGLVRFVGDPRGEMVATINGPRAAWPARFAGYLAAEQRIWTTLRESDETDAARGIQALMTALVAHRSGLKLSFLLGPDADAPPLLMRLSPG